MASLSTFSIVAHDPIAKEWGVAVQSKFLAVAAVASWARAGAGAVATQARVNTLYGPDGLAMLGKGLSAQKTLDRLVAADPGRDQRQAGMVDAQGRAATFTGARLAWIGPAA